MPSVPQLRSKPEECAFGDFVLLSSAPAYWCPVKHQHYQLAGPRTAPRVDAEAGGDPCDAVPPIWTFSLKTWHDPATGKGTKIWQRTR